MRRALGQRSIADAAAGAHRAFMEDVFVAMIEAEERKAA